MSTKYSSITATIAIILTVINLSWSVCNQKEQNRRWNELNNANVDLSGSQFTTFKQLSTKEMKETDWGYTPSIYSVPGSLDQLYLISALTFIDSKTGNMITNFLPAQTLDELYNEHKESIYKSSADSLIPARYYGLNFVFENLGKTTAKNIIVKILFEYRNKWNTLTKEDHLQNLNSGEKKAISFVYTDDLIMLLPQKINFKIYITFTDINNQQTEKIENLIWNGISNTWE